MPTVVGGWVVGRVVVVVVVGVVAASPVMVSAVGVREGVGGWVVESSSLSSFFEGFENLLLGNQGVQAVNHLLFQTPEAAAALFPHVEGEGFPGFGVGG